MDISTLEWDSAFFDYSVGKILIKPEDILNKDFLYQSVHKLIYIFSDNLLTTEQINNLPIALVDTKIMLRKVANKDISIPDEIIRLTRLSDELLYLTYQSGHFSRFKLDSNFIHNEFERMYSSWISKSINTSEESVFGYIINNKLAGFISVSTHNQDASIGLIAVDEKYRGNNIGKHLLTMADVYSKKNKLKNITVNTQESNDGAMRFYLSNGFSVLNKTYIYHLWK